MAMDPSLRETMEVFRAVRDNAAKELQDLYQQFAGQEQLLSDFLGKGVKEAEQQLENIASKGVDAIPDGLRKDVLDAYNNLAQIVNDAPTKLKPWVDPEGAQATRADLTARASQLIESSGGATTGAATFAAWWASLSTAAAVAIMAIGLSLLVILGAAYWAFKGDKSSGLAGKWDITFSQVHLEDNSPMGTVRGIAQIEKQTEGQYAFWWITVKDMDPVILKTLGPNNYKSDVITIVATDNPGWTAHMTYHFEMQGDVLRGLVINRSEGQSPGYPVSIRTYRSDLVGHRTSQ